jgi:hypothetical protein
MGGLMRQLLPEIWGEQKGAGEIETDIPYNIKHTPVDQGAYREGTWSAKEIRRGGADGKGSLSKFNEEAVKKFVQINLHHSKAAMATLCQQLAEGMADIALIQEPWIYEYRGQI